MPPMPSIASRLAVTAAALTADPREAPTLARQAGFAGLAFDAFAPSLFIPDLSVSGRRDFSRRLATTGCPLAALRADLGSHGFMPGADVDRLLVRARQLLEVARDLAAPSVCLDLGPLPPAPKPPATPAPPVNKEMAGLILLPDPPTPRAAEPSPTPPPDPAAVSQVTAALAELGSLADRTNVPLALSASLASFAALTHALVQVRCPWFGIDLDPAALLAGSEDIHTVLSQTRQTLRHVRGRDAVKGEQGRTKPAIIGRGDANWSPLLHLLDEAGFSGWITIDPTDLPNPAAAAIAGLRQLLAWAT